LQFRTGWLDVTPPVKDGTTGAARDARRAVISWISFGQKHGTFETAGRSARAGGEADQSQ